MIQYTDLMEINNPKHRDMVLRRIEGDTLETIGRDYGITRERVRQICRAAVFSLPPHIFDRVYPLANQTKNSVAQHKDAVAKRKSQRGALREHLETGFDRDVISRIAEQDYTGKTDEEICEELAIAFRIRWFNKYMVCSRCTVARPIGEYALCYRERRRPSCICRECNTIRHREWSDRNPVHAAMLSKYHQRENPNRNKIAQLRHYLKVMGRFYEMPPLPPRGIPDSEIVVPVLGWGINSWYHSMTQEQKDAHMAKVRAGARAAWLSKTPEEREEFIKDRSAKAKMARIVKSVERLKSNA